MIGIIYSGPVRDYWSRKAISIIWDEGFIIKHMIVIYPGGFRVIWLVINEEVIPSWSVIIFQNFTRKILKVRVRKVLVL